MKTSTCLCQSRVVYAVIACSYKLIFIYFLQVSIAILGFILLLCCMQYSIVQ